MKKVITTSVLFLVSLVSFSQVFKIQLDTIQFFSHSSDISTPEARKTNQIFYGDLCKYIDTTYVQFDLNTMTHTFEGNVNPIVENYKSGNMLDVKVNEDGIMSLFILSVTETGKTIFMVETIKDGMVRGFFTYNPKYTVE